MRSLRDSLACLPISNLLGPAPMAAGAPAPNSDPTTRSHYTSTQLQGDPRILHALNRFTFGPREGDLESVRAAGCLRLRRPTPEFAPAPRRGPQ